MKEKPLLGECFQEAFIFLLQKDLTEFLLKIFLEDWQDILVIFSNCFYNWGCSKHGVDKDNLKIVG